MAQLVELRIPDLTEADTADLAENLPSGSVRTEGLASDDTSPFGRDVATFAAIVLVSREALRLLAIWIARHTTRDETDISIQTTRPDGATQTVTFRAKSASSQSDDEVLKRLAEVCKVDAEGTPAEAVKGLLTAFSKSEPDSGNNE